MKEVVLYYAPRNAVNVGLVKGVLVQIPVPAEYPTASDEGINEELLVLCGFTEERLEQLLGRLRILLLGNHIWVSMK